MSKRDKVDELIEKADKDSGNPFSTSELSHHLRQMAEAAHWLSENLNVAGREMNPDEKQLLDVVKLRIMDRHYDELKMFLMNRYFDDAAIAAKHISEMVQKY